MRLLQHFKCQKSQFIEEKFSKTNPRLPFQQSHCHFNNLIGQIGFFFTHRNKPIPQALYIWVYFSYTNTIIFVCIHEGLKIKELDRQNASLSPIPHFEGKGKYLTLPFKLRASCSCEEKP